LVEERQLTLWVIRTEPGPLRTERSRTRFHQFSAVPERAKEMAYAKETWQNPELDLVLNQDPWSARSASDPGGVQVGSASGTWPRRGDPEGVLVQDQVFEARSRGQNDPEGVLVQVTGHVQWSCSKQSMKLALDNCQRSWSVNEVGQSTKLVSQRSWSVNEVGQYIFLFLKNL